METVVGLEIHVELKTESKMFCQCTTLFGQEPNTQTCPVCLGLPGSLPVANRKAVEYTIMAGLALNCGIAVFTQFHRKNYFYPDMPKNYQISQYDLPFCTEGHLDVETDESVRRIGVTRVHLEEDTGKLIHVGGEGRIAGAEYSLVDFNRAGIPLMEIVTEPDIRSPEEARAFAQKLRSILLSLGVSDCNMEQGSMRVDANLSLRPAGATELGTKTEVKNMNSFRALRGALAYEVERQRAVLEGGGRVEQETRHWDAARNVTTSLRTKEYAHDYRYFPDPDLVPMTVERQKVDELASALPELPDARKKRFAEQFGLGEHEAHLLSDTKAMGDFFEETVGQGADAKDTANWMLGELSAHLNVSGLDIEESAVTPKHLAQLLKLIADGTISGKIAKTVFEEMFDTGKLPSVIVEEKGMTQISDEEEIAKVVDAVIAENPKAVEELKAGKDKAIGFLVGQVMRLTKGRANPQIVNDLIRRRVE
ncbi:MAG: Asp-tRNA(Asn)/Glu-tRNA(Gln) amidotransferase subunit GatB [Actinobacteria bacterium]|nr:MAG: Asp-tRNA(Asn)/Glu-tRNA(Gln) amidotransferase subunit GatB [Actinomycetota bacterium]